jgi:TPR repeat protein
LAKTYLFGEGLPKNFFKAYQLLNYSADSPLSSTILGDLFFEGELLDKNYQEAFKHYRNAAKKEFPPAIGNLGMMYYQGYGVKKDISKAIYYLKKASELDVASAQTILANLYFIGDDIEEDYSKAIELLISAAKKGYTEAIDSLVKLSDSDNLDIKNKFAKDIDKIIDLSAVETNQVSQEDVFYRSDLYDDRTIAEKWKTVGKEKKSLGALVSKKKKLK